MCVTETDPQPTHQCTLSVLLCPIVELDELRKQLQTLFRKGFHITKHVAVQRAGALCQEGCHSPVVRRLLRSQQNSEKKGRHPLPRIDELIDELIDKFRTARCFSRLDLISGYHQIYMNPPVTLAPVLASSTRPSLQTSTKTQQDSPLKMFFSRAQ